MPVMLRLVNVGHTHGLDAVAQLRGAARIDDGQRQTPTDVKTRRDGISTIGAHQLSDLLHPIVIDGMRPLGQQPSHRCMMFQMQVVTHPSNPMS